MEGLAHSLRRRLRGLACAGGRQALAGDFDVAGLALDEEPAAAVPLGGDGQGARAGEGVEDELAGG